MTDAVVAYEGALHNDWFIVEGALKFPEEGVPVTINFSWEQMPIGKATNFRRTEDGEVMSTITFFDKHHEDVFGSIDIDANQPLYEACIFADKIQSETHDDVCEIGSGTIRALAVVPIPSFPHVDIPKENS